MINTLLFVSAYTMAFNLRQIEVFRAVMITGSIRGAAQLLFVSQPAVSRLLSHTEARVGFPLFERIRGRLSELLTMEEISGPNAVKTDNSTII